MTGVYLPLDHRSASVCIWASEVNSGRRRTSPECRAWDARCGVWTTSSTTSNPDDRYRKVRVTHRFHPLCGREYEFVVHRQNWGELFGCDDYLKAVGMPPPQRKEFLASLYERQLRELGKFLYVSRFEMIEKTGHTSYFLYHCTRSLKGLAVMR